MSHRFHRAYFAATQNSAASNESVFTSPEFVGAFAGAFFAFIFGLVSYYFLKRYERFIQHRNAIIRLERLLNEHLDLMGIYKFGSSTIAESLSKNEHTFNRLDEFPVIKDLTMDLGSLDLINGYFSYERDIYRINVDSRATNYTLTRMEDAALAGKNVAPVTRSALVDHLHNLNKEITKREAVAKKLLCLARVHLNKLKKVGFLSAAWKLNPEVTCTDEELARESGLLEKEIKEVAEQP